MEWKWKVYGKGEMECEIVNRKRNGKAMEAFYRGRMVLDFDLGGRKWNGFGKWIRIWDLCRG